jgi:ribonucleoside-diphosphate reductase alpha chain
LPEFKPFIELDKFNPSNYVISIPVQKVGAITRSQESAIDLLNRMKKINEVWVSKGHYEGKDTHNVSLTVSYKPEEEAGIREWMWNNRNVYCGISLLPYDGGTYVQAPFEEIDKETYERLTAEFPQIDLSGVNFGAAVDERMGEAACGANGCELV